MISAILIISCMARQMVLGVHSHCAAGQMHSVSEKHLALSN